MIGAVWEAMSTRSLVIAGTMTSGIIGYTIWGGKDQNAAKALAENKSKTPTIMQRNSINEFLKKEEAATGKMVRRQSGSMAVFTEGGSALGGAESGSMS